MIERNDDCSIVVHCCGDGLIHYDTSWDYRHGVAYVAFRNNEKPIKEPTVDENGRVSSVYNGGTLYDSDEGYTTLDDINYDVLLSFDIDKNHIDNSIATIRDMSDTLNWLADELGKIRDDIVENYGTLDDVVADVYDSKE